MKYSMHFLLFLLLILPLSSSAEKLLVFRPPPKIFEDLVKVVKEEVGEDLEIVVHVLKKDAEYKEFHDKVRTEKPHFLLLLDNKAVNFAKKFNLEKDDYAKNLKSVATMALNLRKDLKGNKNICAVEYEVPAYTLITSYRFIVKQPVKNVLVFYRGSKHAEIIKNAQAQLKKENIVLKAFDTEVDGASNKKVNIFLKKNLLREIQRKDINLVWIMADSIMLNKENFVGLWFKAAEQNKAPFVAGIKKFSNKGMHLCAYSASPNQQDLGIQVSEMLFGLIDGEAPETLGVEYILSVNKTINMEKLKDNNITVNKNNISDVKLSEN